MANPILNGLMGGQNSNPMSLIMNMMNGGNSNKMLMDMAMGMLQKQNPQAFQQVQQLMQSGRNPEELINEQLKQYKPEQVQELKKMATTYGVPKDILDKLG